MSTHENLSTMFYVQRRNVALLEVLISFTLVVFCALPLIYPQVVILRSEKQFLSLIQLDHALNLVYANLLEKLYRQEIDWSVIDGKQKHPVDVELLKASGITRTLPYTGTYAFIESKRKPTNRTEDTVRMIDLVLTFKDNQNKNEKDLEYKYPIVIEYQPAHDQTDATSKSTS